MYTSWDRTIGLETIAGIIVLYSLNWFIAPRLIEQVIEKRRQRKLARADEPLRGWRRRARTISVVALRAGLVAALVLH